MNRLLCMLIVVVGVLWSGILQGQVTWPERRHTTAAANHTDEFCASDIVRRFAGPTDIVREEEINRLLYDLLDKRKKEERSVLGSGSDEILTIPVVVHIIHDGGSENISDARVLAGMQHLNDAFANVGVYDPSTGVSIGIEFCLAKQDLQGNFTTGITRTQSTMTDLTMENQDIAMKNLSRWDPRRYLNIWLVREITSLSSGPGVAGYAYFPSSHGNVEDGIVGEAEFFGSTTDNSKVFAHEVGHYLGLYHTFEGGCANNDCLANGDRICDTPPDASTSPVICDVPFNSCLTDAADISINNPFRPVANGGMGDQPDLYIDYMDYGLLECYTLFTQGQKDRMRAVLTEIRTSLLESKGCLSPCTASVTASFTASQVVVDVGTTVTFTNTSAGASSYEWRINSALTAATRDLTQTFNTQGRYTVALRAFNGDPACTDEDSITIEVRCPVRASFTANTRTIMPGGTVIFTNTSSGGITYEWLLDGVPIGTSRDLQQTFNTIGAFRVRLVASNGRCSDTSLGAFIRVGACGESNEWNIWYFGHRAGVDFNSGQPVGITDGTLSSAEGVATICDEDGNLLFYSNGRTVQNRNHTLMRNGTGLSGSGLSAQAAVIVPVPLSDSLYYIFTTSNWTDPTKQLQYSIVDISLDGGLGEVTSVNVPLNNNVSERVTATPHSNCTDIWIVSHEQENDRFVAYLLTPNGLMTTPVISSVGSISTGNNRYGYLKFSQDGKRLSSTLGGSTTLPTVEVFDFDNTTGQVSNPIVLFDQNGMLNAYSSEFSPNGRFLYVSEFTANLIYQFDLAAGSPYAIRASRRVVAGAQRNMACHQLGPDGRIYTVSRGSTYLSMIEFPNLRGDACGFVPDAVDLKGGIGEIGLPNFMSNYGERSMEIEGPDSICINDSVQTFTVASSGCSALTYIWRAEGDAEIISSSDNMATVRVTGVGSALLIVERVDNCGVIDDTLRLTVEDAPQIDLGADSALCSGAIVLLDAGPGFASYRWQDGSNERRFQAQGPGIYWVEVMLPSGCPARDTVEIFPDDRDIPVSLGPDTSICDGGVVVLDAGAGAVRYRWQDGSAESRFTAFRPGRYWVEAIGHCGRAFDTIVILPGSPPIDLGSDTVICGGVDRLLDAGPGFSSYEWQDGSTGRTFRAAAPGIYQVRGRTGTCESVGMIRIEQEGESLAVSLAATPAVEIMPGMEITIPLRLSVQSGRRLSPGSSYSASIRFNARLLAPVGDTPLGTIHGKERVITISGAVGSSDTIALLTFLVLLGDSDQAAIMIDSFSVGNTCVMGMARESGVIMIDLCDIGNSRTIEERGDVVLKVTAPATTGGSITVDYRLIEEGETRLSLVNALGERVKILLDEKGTAGNHVATIDAGELAQGLYIVLLETPTRRLMEKIMVGR